MKSTGEPGQTSEDLVSFDEIDTILAGQHHDPHSVLGAHQGPGGMIVRALRPLAWSVSVVLPDGSRYPMQHLHSGVFSATGPAALADGYQIAVRYSQDAPEIVSDDP